MFRTPTLRNVGLRGGFFHNGAMHRLGDVVRFYAQRDARPAAWYSRDAGGVLRPYDDLPPEYRSNLDRRPPFDRQSGDGPAFSDRDASDIVAFLQTLTDGYAPAAAAAIPGR